MATYALVLGGVGGVVENVAIANDPAIFPSPPYTAVLLNAGTRVQPGWLWAGGQNFAPPVPTLEKAKLEKIAAIDQKSLDLFTEGFVFQGLVFSLSQDAQDMLAHMIQFSASLSYPFFYSTQDELGSVAIASVADVYALVAPGLARVESVLSEGGTLKDQVRACTTVAQVEAIQDNRV